MSNHNNSDNRSIEPGTYIDHRGNWQIERADELLAQPHDLVAYLNERTQLNWRNHGGTNWQAIDREDNVFWVRLREIQSIFGETTYNATMNGELLAAGFLPSLAEAISYKCKPRRRRRKVSK